MTTPRKLETLLRVRRLRRDQIRMALGRLLADSRRVEDAVSRSRADRAEALVELRKGTAQGRVDIDRIASLRYRAAHLSIELAGLTQAAEANAERAGKVRALLVKADQSVKAVERLQERLEEERRRRIERVADRDATDRFAAARAPGSAASSEP